MPSRPARTVWLRNCAPRVALIVSLDRAVIGNGSDPYLRTVTSSVASLALKPAMSAARDLDVATRDRVLDDRRGHDGVVERDREIGADVLRRVVGELVLTVVLEHEVDGRSAVLVGADGRRGDLVAAEQRWVLLRVEDLVGRGLGRPEGNEVEQAGLADQVADGLGVRDAGQLDDDAVLALGRDHGLGDASGVDPALDDILDDGHVGRRSAPGRRRACAWYSARRPPSRSRPSLVTIGRHEPSALEESGSWSPGRKSIASARIPMSRMRIGPALRIEAGCYTEDGRVASDPTGRQGSTAGR